MVRERARETADVLGKSMTFLPSASAKVSVTVERGRDRSAPERDVPEAVRSGGSRRRTGDRACRGREHSNQRL